MNPVQIAVDAVGGQTAAAKICGLSVVAVHKWTVKGRLPRTEYTKKTNYAVLLAAAAAGKFTAEWLLSAANPDKEHQIEA
ncbi:helix-turn-helix domain-containing protein [Yersinia intermedia]|uniref:helix-turn-helix domain-containing protein n=1 Tax=Yersinia intermedia TaxID=631 RepID=UPI001CFF3885|nr:helix-turn-helix domain-containing protein [Yersinia intermedia]MCB5329307.1 helix-turn-helix domain-containing protein [Yersinia intermedia]